MARSSASGAGMTAGELDDEIDLDEELDEGLDEELDGGLDADSGPTLRPAGRSRHRATFIEMLVSSLISLVASLVLSIDAVRLAANPLVDLSCNISSKISCSTVGLSWQAQLLGFPNAFLGLIFEPIVITLAVASLAGVRFPRWFMLSAQALYTIAIGFAYWLFLQAYFVIGALCPWCLVVTIATTLVFTSMTRVNLLDGNIRLPGRAHERVCYWLRMGADVAVAAILIAIIAAMVIARYL